MATDLQGHNLSTGHQSEPTTPPEYRDHVFPSIYSRRNRYSSSSLVSPPGLINRLSRSGSQLTSPPTEPAQTQASEELDKLPSKSVPGSRRGSTDRISSYLPENILSSQRSTAKYVRYVTMVALHACISLLACNAIFLNLCSYHRSAVASMFISCLHLISIYIGICFRTFAFDYFLICTAACRNVEVILHI